MWRIITPSLCILILAATWAVYEPMKYDKYVFPTWANIVGWIVSFVSVSAIPIVMVLQLIKTPGSIGQRFRTLLRPASTWGPRLEEDRAKAEKNWAQHGYISPPTEKTFGNHDKLKQGCLASNISLVSLYRIRAFT